MEKEQEYKRFVCQFKLENDETMIRFPGESFQSLASIVVKEELLKDENYQDMLHPSIKPPPPITTKTEEGEYKLDQVMDDVEMQDQQILGPQPDRYDPNNRCRPCEKMFNSRAVYLTHLRSIHQIYFYKPKPKPTPKHQVQPDINDPNNYCKSCEKTFNSRTDYLHHLRSIHQIYFYKRKPKSTHNLQVQPDINDPNNYCKSCDKIYKHINSYVNHLRKIHNIKHHAPKIIPQPQVLPDENDPNNYCRACNNTFKTNKDFRTHIQKVHNDVGNKPEENLNKIKKPDEHVIVDEYDTGKHCQVCELGFNSRRAYLGHLRNTHKVILILKGSKKSILLNRQIIRSKSFDTGKFCNSCRQTFGESEDYIRHLQSRSHKLIVLQNAQCTKISPSDGRSCSICKKILTSREYYRRHLKTKGHKLNMKEKQKTSAV